ncbi:PP2C family protein-serine/threonine phosphatase [Streptomyces sp. TP-A0874]|uniref:PP2C family protein-serine/threonine phosphatase n=1 Tax=Streptomyces sp. TP-A0874 TaxID=549819 RepID=UPI0008529258|nr:GAF domain-containing SpoIIE family protein phosphatase [Streptomyces sp. TP-A0874]
MTGDPQPDSALDQARAYLQLVAEATTALASSPDGEEGVRRLARLTVPRLGRACVVDLLEGRRIQRVEVAHAEASDALLGTLASESFALPDASALTLTRVLRGAGPLTVADMVEEAGSGTALGDAQRRLCYALDARSGLIVPLVARHRILGALTFLRSPTDPAFGEEERALAAELGHWGALVLDNSRLYRLHQRAAEEVQRSLLPNLDSLGEWPLTARYLPAQERAEVGGDWYDAFHVPDGSTMLAIGDVIGHDLTAALHMSELRNMARALTYDSRDTPGGVMRRLDRVMQGLTDIQLVTAIIGRIRMLPNGEGQLQWSNAGHPPPLVTRFDGRTSLLEADPDPVLGADTGLSRTDHLETLPPHSTLLLYTDGLVERPGESLTQGLIRLRQHAAALAGQPLDVFCDELLARMVIDYQDDVALLALRVPG